MQRYVPALVASSTVLALALAGFGMALHAREPDSAWFILSVGILLAGVLAFYIVEQVRSNERIQAAETQRQALENQLVRSQKLEAVGSLVGGIAHDFNNLLTSIIGYVELAQVDTDATRNAEYLEQIRLGGEKGRGLIRKLLRFSRGEPTQAAPQSLPALVESTLDMLRPVLPARIDLHYAYAPDLPQVCIDPTSLDQLVINLCINARDAIDGSGRISINITQYETAQAHCIACAEGFGGHYVELCVEDSGTGIAAETLEHVFQAFYTTKEGDKGTGLGLSIIHTIMHACDGHILLSSQAGEGARFHLLFPAAAIPAGAEAN